jgi:hypothetical protein
LPVSGLAAGVPCNRLTGQFSSLVSPILPHPLTFASSGILLQQKPLLQGLLVPAFLLAPLSCAEAVGYRRETTGWDR